MIIVFTPLLMISYRNVMNFNAFMKALNKANLWKTLDDHARSLSLYVSANLMQQSASEREQFNVSSCNIHLDYSHQHLTPATLKLLFELANACDLNNKIQSLMRGDNINISEKKPALHTALRASGNTPIMVNNHNVMPDIIATRKKMQMIVEQIREKKWLGFSGKPITDIVNIGIGGSDLGPRFSLKALEEFCTEELSYHFISDADPSSFKNAVDKLQPETTLFIVSSKSFTTKETLYNAKKALKWIGASHHQDKHFIAITANSTKAHQFGITTILPIWDWVGGRFSFCSAINLITAIAIGFDHFNQLLDGASSMDEHFQTSDFTTNLPVLLALIGIWNNNFLHIHSLLMWTYSQLLTNFVPYIQQLDMESNGKSIDNQGKAINHASSPIIWGGMGNQAQHSYYQMLCQGTHKVAIDFISLDALSGEIINNICNAKIRVLTEGVNDQENQNNYIPGQVPVNHIRISNLTPFTIGALAALYEHKVFVQSVIWDINPFDQPGVESAKHYAYEQEREQSIL
jgi:glucose-6-phosphate isomerase